MLEWVVDGARTRHCDDFVGLPPGKRPRVRCPLCGERVVLHLGSQIAHHAKHRDDSTCAATAPETALHLNAKHALRQALQTVATRVGIPVGCERWFVPEGLEGQLPASFDPELHPCKGYTNIVVADAWDSVELEVALDSKRPDLLLTRTGMPVLAIEILVSHAMTDEKVAAFGRKRVPWMEVPAKDVFVGLRERLARGTLVLKPPRHSFEERCCPECARQASAFTHLEMNHAWIAWRRPVDVFDYVRRRSHRRHWYVREVVRGGQLKELQLLYETQDDRRITIATFRGGDPDLLWPELDKRLLADVRRLLGNKDDFEIHPWTLATGYAPPDARSPFGILRRAPTPGPESSGPAHVGQLPLLPPR